MLLRRTGCVILCSSLLRCLEESITIQQIFELIQLSQLCYHYRTPLCRRRCWQRGRLPASQVSTAPLVPPPLAPLLQALRQLWKQRRRRSLRPRLPSTRSSRRRWCAASAYPLVLSALACFAGCFQSQSLSKPELLRLLHSFQQHNRWHCCPSATRVRSWSVSSRTATSRSWCGHGRVLLHHLPGVETTAPVVPCCPPTYADSK